MRLIDADKAKAELLRIARDIHDCCGFYDGLKAGYQSAADRLDTIPTAEKECDKGHWINNFGYQGFITSEYSLKNPYQKPFDFTQVKV